MFFHTTSAILFAILLSGADAVPLAIRDSSPSDADLFASCPGGVGSHNIEKADRCTLLTPTTNPDKRIFTVVGNPEQNCDGGTNPVTVTIGGSTTVSTTNTVDGGAGINIDGIKIGGGFSNTKTTTTTMSNSTTFSVPPGRQVVQVVGVNHHSQTGRVQVNFGDRVDGHFIWFTQASVTQLTPDPSDMFFDIHESACGADPRDLSSLNH
ncbi:hypothetical protein HETIRDRAFT_452658 [Heterobasidion irregulare TC 32-1]|uniref:Uncharacterized protein n=1 Tax=Heterobasidion irregulare (strain TC 32-1) TaxID=747525 RepID=W4K191_HETIT|nr:uncharacterized protein HETIRDRAFT_452658 [Heterobasidion irregulare TC 32-1]ETW79489.1 hypothetical protein HETIRDRAFT_452658 [Heterobasidion irregulare TC 32-1]